VQVTKLSGIGLRVSALSMVGGKFDSDHDQIMPKTSKMVHAAYSIDVQHLEDTA